MASQGRGWVLGCSLAFFAFLFTSGALLLIFALQLSPDGLDLPRPGPKVGVVEVFGVLGQDDDVVEQLERLADDRSVKALVLHVNCPGGAVGTTQRIITRLEAFKADGLPIVAALDDVAASGGYYVATAADSIFALPGTLTGSIGVIMAFPDFSGLMHKVGVEYQVVKAGPHKDAGSPFRPLTPEERGWITGVLTDVHEQFIAAIASSRPMEPDSVRAVADGRIFSGSQALAAGLVDRLADLDEAVAAAGAMAGIEGEPATVRKHKPRPAWQRWLEGRFPGAGLPLPGRWPRLEYRWR